MGLTSSGLDELLRPALELAWAVARAGVEAEPLVPPPAGLRPFLRLTWLPPRALGPIRRVLDTDDEFRSRVAEAAREEQVGRAGWLLLHRPEGWEDELRALEEAASAAEAAEVDEREERSARRKLTGVEEARRRAESARAQAESARAQAEGRLVEERRARREALAALADLQRQLESLRAERDEANARLAESLDRAQRLEAEVELARSEAHAAKQPDVEPGLQHRSATGWDVGSSLGRPAPAAAPEPSGPGLTGADRPRSGGSPRGGASPRPAESGGVAASGRAETSTAVPRPPQEVAAMAEPPPGLASSLTAPDAALAGATGVPDGNCRGPEALAEADLAGLVSPGPLDVADAVADAAGAAARLAAALAAAAAALGARVDPGSQSPERGQTLAPEPPPCRPDASAQGAPPRVPLRLPLGIYDDSVEAAEFLVRRPNVVLLVDGYNATLSASQWASLGIAEQRRRLTDALAELAARTGAEIEVVFDGAEATMGPGAGPARRPVRVVFSPPGVEADDIVIERAAQLPTTRPVVVASSDRRVQEGARHYGANVIGSDQLMALLRARR